MGLRPTRIGRRGARPSKRCLMERGAEAPIENLEGDALSAPTFPAHAPPRLAEWAEGGHLPRDSVLGLSIRRIKKARCLVSKAPGIILAMTYSRTTYRSTTIGSAAFHFRVRDGNGWFHCARSPDFENPSFQLWKLKSSPVWRPEYVREQTLFFENRTLGEKNKLR